MVDTPEVGLSYLSPTSGFTPLVKEKNMNDAVIALIRTIVPIGVGALITWLALLGVELDPEIAAATITSLTGLISAAYYAVVKVVSVNVPWVGWFLGYPANPTYETK
jgi:hypothetical protein